MQWASCTTSCTGWTFLSGCMQYKLCANGPSMSASQSTAVHNGLLHPHLRHCSSPASAVRRLTIHQLFVGLPRHRRSMFGRRTFCEAGPAWNSLPDYLRDPSRSFDSFRRDLKTLLFSFYQRTQCIRGFANMRYKCTTNTDIGLQ